MTSERSLKHSIVCIDLTDDDTEPIAKIARTTKATALFPDASTSGVELIITKQGEKISEISMKIYGDPIVQERPRWSRVSRRMYDPVAKEKRELKKKIKDGLERAGVSFPIFTDCAVEGDFFFALGRKKSHFVGGLFGGKLKANTIPAYKTPKDLDNLEKFVLDSCNGVIYGDDRQATKLTQEKALDNETYVGFTIFSCHAR